MAEGPLSREGSPIGVFGVIPEEAPLPPVSSPATGESNRPYALYRLHAHTVYIIPSIPPCCTLC